jgi:hypothetical protein
MNKLPFHFDEQIEWKFVTDLGKIVTLPCPPWQIIRIKNADRYAVYCETSIYWVYPDEANRLKIQARIERSTKLLDKAIQELMK